MCCCVCDVVVLTLLCSYVDESEVFDRESPFICPPHLSPLPVPLTCPPHLSPLPAPLTRPPHLSPSPVPLTCPPHLSPSPVPLTCPSHLSPLPVPLTCPPHLSPLPVPLTCPPYLSPLPVPLTCPPHLSPPPVPSPCGEQWAIAQSRCLGLTGTDIHIYKRGTTTHHDYLPRLSARQSQCIVFYVMKYCEIPSLNMATLMIVSLCFE